jgi:hypothetical protein
VGQPDEARCATGVRRGGRPALKTRLDLQSETVACMLMVGGKINTGIPV